MKTYKRKESIKLLLTLLFLSIIFFGVVGLDSSSVYSLQPIKSSEALITEHSYQSITLNSSSLEHHAIDYGSFNQNHSKIYNFVVPMRFDAESILVSDIWDYNKTYLNAFKQMYNTGQYSAKEYYKNVSNGKVEIESVFITESVPIAIKNPRENYLKKTSSNINGYDSGNETQRTIEIIRTGFEAVVEYIETNDFYKDKADFNGDGKIDSISFIIMPNQNFEDPNHSDMLWPHMSGVDGWPIYYTDALGNKIYPSGYMLDYMGGDELNAVDAVMETPSPNTACHELGHLVFNWPDLYVYNNETDVSALEYPNPVLFWDIMSYSHIPRLQYPLTYMREKATWGSNQGFVNQNQIVEITKNGEYTLQPVNYEEMKGLPFSSERVLAHKLVNPDFPTQAIYIEYRKQANDFFDGDFGDFDVQNGLIIYLVDEGFSVERNHNPMGNIYGTPYNVFVYRGALTSFEEYDLSALARAPLNMTNKSVGEGANYLVAGFQYESPNLFWNSYSTPTQQGQVENLQYIDSGIVIKVISENTANQSLTFTVDWDMLLDANMQIERTEIEDQNLYNALLSQAGKSSSELLNLYDFLEKEYIDLSSRNITSLNSLSVLEFKGNVFINLADNNLTSLNNYEDYYKLLLIKPTLNLAFNKFSLAEIQKLKGYSSNIIFAMQKPGFSMMVYSPQNTWQDFEEKVILHQNDFSNYYNLETNYQKALISGKNVLEQTGEIYFKFVSSDVYNLGSKEIKINVMGVFLSNTLQNVEVFDNFDIENCITLENISWQEIAYQLFDNNNIIINTEELTQTIGLKQIKFVLKQLEVELLFEFLVEDNVPPKIVLKSSTFFVLRDALIPPLVDITDNYDSQEDLQFITQPSLNMLQNGKNEVKIFAEDSSGNKSVEKTVIIIVLEISIKNNLKVLYGQEFDYHNSYDFLPVAYLDSFDLQVECDINVDFVATQKLVLSFTNKQNEDEKFVISGFIDVVDEESPVIELLSSEKIYVFKDQSYEIPQVKITDNYDENLLPKYVQKISTSSAGEKMLEIYAEDLSGNRSETISIIIVVIEVIEKKNITINVYSEISYEDLLIMTPTKYFSEFNIEVLKSVDVSKIGLQDFEIKVYHSLHAETSKEISGAIKVVDIEAPTIIFEKNIKEVYMYKGDLFLTPEFIVSDNYDKKEDLIVTIENTIRNYGVGRYECTYTVTDKSGNFSEAILYVNVLLRPIENLEVVQVSNIKIITPNTSMTFMVDANNIELENRFGTVNMAWFINGKIVEVTKERYFSYTFKKAGTYNVEVRAENTYLDGDKSYSQEAQSLVVVVDKGGFLDRYALIGIAIGSVVLIGILIATSIIKKRRRMF